MNYKEKILEKIKNDINHMDFQLIENIDEGLDYFYRQSIFIKKRDEEKNKYIKLSIPIFVPNCGLYWVTVYNRDISKEEKDTIMINYICGKHINLVTKKACTYIGNTVKKELYPDTELELDNLFSFYAKSLNEENLYYKQNINNDIFTNELKKENILK